MASGKRYLVAGGGVNMVCIRPEFISGRRYLKYLGKTS